MRSIVFLAFTAACWADIHIVDVNDRVFNARSVSIETDGGRPFLVFEDLAGKTQRMECQDVVEVSFGPLQIPNLFGPADVRVVCTNGDLFYATITKDGEHAHLKSEHLGEFDFPFERIQRIEFMANRDAFPKLHPSEIREDTFLTVKGDRPKGTLIRLGPQELQYRSGNDDFPLLVKDLAIVYLLPLGDPPAVPKDLYAIVTTRDGSTLQGHILGLSKGVLTFKSLYNQDFSIATSAIAGIYFKNGRVIYLSDMEFKADEDANYIRGLKPAPSDFKDEFRFRRDKSVKDTKLSIRGHEFKKGLGVHARSKLTVPLGGVYKKFITTIGIDDIAQGFGNAVFEIWVDGKKVFSRTMTGNDDPHTVSLSVEGAQELVLLVDFGEDGNTGDCADWAMARLIR